ncbi:GNAT family N-acetyltransferase [Massilia sp. ZL223]|uniref:GNAT family N-acetyltransferase n=1 Tax=Massilia sp. ZL223 TaxID=2824904 RepID=UPI001B8353AB|nr:GNAT family N-acetyltransferase [Massilia sp. ZL223]MBQ5965640.1 GNAT family N-acetyltransferase [Massilia sp. ZL223]
MSIEVSLSDKIDRGEVIHLYRANGWSSADKPDQLMAGLRNSHALVTVRIGDQLIGLGNAISDGHLLVYFPHMLVDPVHQGAGVGRKMMEALLDRYAGFHQMMLTADGEAIEFYKRLGFERAGKTEPMWIYAGTEH